MSFTEEAICHARSFPRACRALRTGGNTEADINNFLEIVSSYSYFSLHALYNPLHPFRSSFAHPRRDLSRSSSQISIFFHPFFPPFPSPSFRSHRISNSGIRGMRIVVASSSVGCKRSHTEEEEGRRKRRGEGKRDPKQRQTVVNRAQTSGARVPVSLVHIGSNLQTRPCHVAGKRFAYLLFSLRRIVPLRSRYFSSYLYVVINNACNSPP